MHRVRVSTALIALVSGQSRTRFVVETFDEAGLLLGTVSKRAFDDDSHFAQASRALGVDKVVLLRCVSTFRRADPPVTEMTFPLVEPVHTTFRIRELAGGREPVECKTFEDALFLPIEALEPVVEWDGTEACAAVDLDFHGCDVPPPAELERLADQTGPRATWWWITAHGGLRLIYFATDKMMADELAAVAAVQLRRAYPAAGIEILSRTRRPRGEPRKHEQTSDCSSLERLYGGHDVLQEEIDTWLEQRDMEVGKRYPHTKCPISPSARALANTDPVVVHPDGVQCYVCAADGMTIGDGLGQFKWAKLCGAEKNAGELRKCVDNFTNWDHASHILRLSDDLPEPLARKAYSAMLRLKHGRDPRVAQAFAACGEKGLVRMNGYWATRDGEPLQLSSRSHILAALPAAQLAGRVCPQRLEWLAQTTKLDELGYAALTPIWGCRLTEFQPTPEDRVFVVLQTSDLRHPRWTSRRPKYVSAGSRALEEDAWLKIETAYPGVNRKIVELLVVAKGCAEICSGLPPMVFLSGPTGAGKSATIALATGICGDRVTRIVFSQDVDRFFGAIRTARASGTFAAFEEFIKHASRSGKTPEGAMEVLLSFDSQAVTHMLYVGPVSLGDLPAFVWTDTIVPPEVMSHAQIGRRMHHAFLPSEMHWEESLAAAGIERPGTLRLALDDGFAAASDAILSAVVDRHFRGSATDFAQVAESLGFKKLRESDHADERKQLVTRFFAMVCEKSGGLVVARGDDARRWPATSGWVIFHLDDGSEAAGVWSALCDRMRPESSQVIAEMDLQAALKLRRPVVFDCRRHGYKMAVRFRATVGNFFNGELQ